MRFPILPLESIILFPQTVCQLAIDFDVIRPIAEASEDTRRQMMLVFSREPGSVPGSLASALDIGVLARILDFRRTGENEAVVRLMGVSRMRVVDADASFLFAEVRQFRPIVTGNPAEQSAMTRIVLDSFASYVDLNPRLDSDCYQAVRDRGDPAFLSDHIAQYIECEESDKQKLLLENIASNRISLLYGILREAVADLECERSLRSLMHDNTVGRCREQVIRDKIRLLQNELGEADDHSVYVEKIKKSVPKEFQEQLLNQAKRLETMPQNSSEAAMIIEYLDVCLELPWKAKSKSDIDIEQARKTLEKEHYGIHKVKERILEYLAVCKRTKKVTGPILCLVGAPGVGKTSIAESIAHATERKFCRIALGGMHDEADIRGHRRTYLGSMPGNIIKSLIRAETKNPVVLLDEIDKIGRDNRGDPAYALLEVLDPEQNKHFKDHFLDFPFDLSNILFIATANTTDSIPDPLRDRMEIIEVPSYTDEEKLEIAKRYLVPKQKKKNGIKSRELNFTVESLREIVSGYTREAGVRELERKIAAVCRKAALKETASTPETLSSEAISDYLGVRRYTRSDPMNKDTVGMVNGLAFTQVGGEVLEVEAGVVDGTGKLLLTGNLGKVMEESAKAALTYIRSRSKELGIDAKFYKNKDIHIHFPEGAVPKDGPSAGITVALAMISALSKKPVRKDIAMTGEITLGGRVLPIGGLREKTMAAFRAGIKTVIVPQENQKDLSELDPKIRDALRFEPVEHMDAVTTLALGNG